MADEPQRLPGQRSWAAEVATGYGSVDYRRKDRARSLTAWHGMLLERLPDYDAADRLDQIAVHQAFAGAEHRLFRARPARQHGDMERRATWSSKDWPSSPAMTNCTFSPRRSMLRCRLRPGGNGVAWPLAPVFRPLPGWSAGR